ncbi:hypothetical protein QR680_015648 [Steinernema hermaphroditum]|uniref:Aminotransferase class I/classII large domain-containing protein n=1 Tax=Steinernema hermaphroditum TaxID=289476 RepID=A0AA39H8K0_9BILA|nr:hypothetical protein QR680_015648 [Steinernema hermaphroditum]
MLTFGDDIIREDLRNTGDASNIKFNNRIRSMIAEGRTIYHFGFGQPPFPVPQAIVQGLRDNADKYEYLSVPGISALREEILKFHEHFGDFDHFTIDSLVLAPRAKLILFTIMQCFNGEILLVAPSWNSYQPQAELSQRATKVIVTKRENNYVPTAEDIEEALAKMDPSKRKILIINTPNNPTGHVFTENELKALADVCRKHEIVVISDEIYARVTLQNHHSLSKYYPEGTIVTTGFSKWPSVGGWRFGYALFPASLRHFQKVVSGSCSQTITCAPTPMQYGFAQALKKLDELEKFCTDTSTILDICGIKSEYFRHLKSVGVIGNAPEGAYYWMPDFEVVRSDYIPNCTIMCDRLLSEANVALMPCGPHYLRPEDEFTVRFCFINFDGREALKAIESFDGDEDKFVRQYCTPLAEGVDALKKWVVDNIPAKK